MSAAAPSLKPPSPSEAQRRQWLLRATGTIGGLGLVAGAGPFVASLEPSARARAQGGPVEAGWADLQPGQMRTVAWRGQPVWLLRRSPAMVTTLEADNPDLVDPDSRRSDQPAACRNATRSLQAELFVAVGICTHLGCSPGLKIGDPAFRALMHDRDGFLCPCHGSRFDLAGRVVRNVPAPINLVVPPYKLQAAQRVVIG